MIGENLKWKLVEQGENQLKLEVLFSKESGIFEGHFPDFPLVAGVLQIHWAIRTFEKFQKTKVAFSGFKNIKFFSPIFPGTLVLLSCEFDDSRLTFQYSSGEKVFSKGVVGIRHE